MRDNLAQVMPAVRAGANADGTRLLRRPRRRLLRLYTTVVLAVILGFVYLDIPTFVYTLDEGFLPKYFFYAFSVIVVPLLLLKFRALTSYLTSPFSLWAIALIMLNIAHLLPALIDDESRANLIGTRIQIVLLALLLGFACSTTRTASLERMFLFLAVMIPALVIWDFLSPGMLYPTDTEGAVLGRAAATFINSNKAGEAMLLVCLLAIPVLRPHVRSALLLLVMTGVILTFSRAAVLGSVLLWAFLLVRKAVPKYTLAFPLVALGVLSWQLGSFENYLSGRQDLAGGLANILDRLEFLQGPAFGDESLLERAQVSEAGLDLFLQNPIFGAGAGATHLWSLRGGTHNQPLMMAAEYGVFGIALWVWLAVILWKGRYFQDKKLQLVAASGFVFLSMFSHNIFDFLYWLVTFAVVSGQRRA